MLGRPAAASCLWQGQRQAALAGYADVRLPWGVVCVRVFTALVFMTAVLAAVGCGEKAEPVPVVPVNHPPVMRAQNDTSIAAGDTLELWFTAEDPDRDILLYDLYVVRVVSWCKYPYDFDASLYDLTGYFRFVAHECDRPSRTFRVSVCDLDSVDSTWFTVSVE